MKGKDEENGDNEDRKDIQVIRSKGRREEEEEGGRDG